MKARKSFKELLIIQESFFKCCLIILIVKYFNLLLGCLKKRLCKLFCTFNTFTNQMEAWNNGCVLGPCTADWKCHWKGFLERGWTFKFIVELFLLLLLPVRCIMNEWFLWRTSADAIDQRENKEHCRKWDVESDEMDESHCSSNTNRFGSKQ